MKLLYTCCACKQSFEAIEKHFYKFQIEKARNDKINRTSLGQCKSCAKEYGERYRNSLKERKLTRSKRNIEIASTVIGTVYVIGTCEPKTPYKIGITAGENVELRRGALQTSHWMELKIVWKSNLLRRADILEKKLHEHFRQKRIRGEWFSLTKKDIKEMSKLVEHFGVE